MTEKGCDNCYYSFFDERAYPCSLCIRGVERTDMWQPSKKTKADRKTEDLQEQFYWRNWKDRMWAEAVIEPQTDNGIGCSRCEGRFDCYDRDMPHAVHCNNYGKVTDEPQTERSE